MVIIARYCSPSYHIVKIYRSRSWHPSGVAWNFFLNTREDNIEWWRPSKLGNLGACSDRTFLNLGFRKCHFQRFFFFFSIYANKLKCSCWWFSFPTSSIISKAQFYGWLRKLSHTFVHRYHAVSEQGCEMAAQVRTADDILWTKFLLLLPTFLYSRRK